MSRPSRRLSVYSAPFIGRAVVSPPCGTTPPRSVPSVRACESSAMIAIARAGCHSGKGTGMHVRGTLAEVAGDPGRYAGHSSGHLRRSFIDRAAGSVHQEVVVGELAPGGRVDRHLHAFEEALYVL